MAAICLVMHITPRRNDRQFSWIHERQQRTKSSYQHRINLGFMHSQLIDRMSIANAASPAYNQWTGISFERLDADEKLQGAT